MYTEVVNCWTRKGKPPDVAVKKVKTIDVFSSNDTESKYHQSKTVLLMGETLGPSSDSPDMNCGILVALAGAEGTVIIFRPGVALEKDHRVNTERNTKAP